MVNKRGFLRIIEASLAIVAIMSVLFLFYTREHEAARADYSQRAASILEEISRNQTIRSEILIDENSTLISFIDEKMPENTLSYEIRICDVTDVCGQSSFTSGEVFSSQRVISSNITMLNPRKVKLFIWRNQ